ncbi:MAG: AAA family ATPase [Deltaproteobacteria bacterium]|jgi:hypothetical protein|nr:AAA family ATPase [Deltaproteobacteria bacterium]
MRSEYKILPSNSSSFLKIRQENLLYIDKTEYIHNLLSIKSSNNWFLARPSGFGKTLFIDTLEQLFLGHEELFRGLFIHSKGYDFKPCPVVRLNMDMSSSSKDDLNAAIISALKARAKEDGLALMSRNPGEALEGLIYELYEKNNNQPIAVLIDDYDKPILDHFNHPIKNPKLLLEIQEFLCDFYVSVKRSAKYLGFVFMTGISEVGETDIHSRLTILKDISQLPLYGGICGFTETEIIDNFHPLFDNLLMSLIKSRVLKKGADHKVLINSVLKKYEYCWDEKTIVFCPSSIIEYFI